MSEAVLVTGGGGFIGTWVLRELLARGMRPVVFDVGERPPRWQRILGERAAEVILVRGSLLDHEQLGRVCDEQRVTRVIHLAALLTPACQEDPLAGCQVNVLGSVALFEQVRARSDQIQGLSYASSLAVFGPEPDDGSAPSGSGNRPPSFYGAFKKSVELIAEQYWLHFQIRSFGIRPHIVYGPERDQGLTAGPSLAARAAARGEQYVINYRGRAGYDYVEDVARAFVRAALETPPGAHVVDLPSEPASVEDIAAAIAAACPGAAPRISVNGPTIPANESLHTEVITQYFPDWQPTALREGLRRTVEFYRTAR
jgi:nucleoside-diphosphate-sugar epimerase